MPDTHIERLQVGELESKLRELTSQYEAAVEEKVKCQEAADTTAKTISLANRLVGGLASENVRWKNSGAAHKCQMKGNILVLLCGVHNVDLT